MKVLEDKISSLTEQIETKTKQLDALFEERETDKKKILVLETELKHEKDQKQAKSETVELKSSIDTQTGIVSSY